MRTIVHRSKNHMVRLGVASLALVIVVTVVVAVFRPAGAAFDKNLIIDDMVFDNVSTMNESDIHTFLNSFPNGCLKNYNAPEPLDYNSYGSNVPASRVIYKASRLWGINPQVILTTLQKEQAIITGGIGCDPQRYNAAMGMGCPDGGACPAPAYAGFHQQVTKGSWQLKFNKERSLGNVAWNGDGSLYYSGPMTEGVHKRSINSTAIPYDGLHTINGETVYMSNGATASLYRYTPHFSGNRSFVTIFESWFGTVFGSDLVRTLNNPTVYLISGSKKHPISSIHLADDLRPLGGIVLVSDAFMEDKTLDKPLGRTIANSTGTVYFVDSGIKLPFNSCGLVADYNLACGDEVRLTEFQLRKLATGPGMTNILKTTDNMLYHVGAGEKQQAYDRQSLQQAGLWNSFNLLQPDALYHVPFGNPVMRNNVVAYSVSSGQRYFYANATFTKIPPGLLSLPTFSNLSQQALFSQSIQSHTIDNGFNGYVRNAASSAHYMLDQTGKIPLTDPSQWSSTFYQLSDEFLQNAPTSNQPVNNKVVKASDNPTVYLIRDKKRHPISSWADLEGLRPSPLAVSTVPSLYLSQMTAGASPYAPGSLIKSSAGATVKFVDGLFGARSLGSFMITDELGVKSGLRTVSQANFDAQTDKGLMSTKIACSGEEYVGVAGRIYRVSVSMMSRYGWNDGQFIGLDASTCTTILKTPSDLGAFLLAPNGTIYQVESGQKRPIASYEAYLTAGGNSSNTIKASNFFLDGLPNGAMIN